MSIRDAIEDIAHTAAYTTEDLEYLIQAQANYISDNDYHDYNELDFAADNNYAASPAHHIIERMLDKNRSYDLDGDERFIFNINDIWAKYPDEIKHAFKTPGFHVIGYTHHNPYDGCWHHWETMLIHIAHTGTPHERKMTIWRIFAHPKNAFGRLSWANTSRHVYFDEDDIKEPHPHYDSWAWGPAEEGPTLITENSLPTAYALYQLLGLTFEWTDDYGRKTTDEPFMMTGYSGNGGVGINISGWITRESFYDMYVWDIYDRTYIPVEDALELFGGAWTSRYHHCDKLEIDDKYLIMHNKLIAYLKRNST